MGSVKTRKRNLNRYRKVYPYLRRRPVNAYIVDGELAVEAASINFVNSSSMTHVFKEVFDSVPTITAISVDVDPSTDSEQGSYEADVNVFVTAVTTTQVTFETSDVFTGRIHFHAIRAG